MDTVKTPYVAIVDGDDYVANDYLSALYELCEKNKVDVAMCGVVRAYDSEGNGNRFDSGFNKNFISSDREWILKNSSFSVCNKLFRTSLFEGMRFPLDMRYEDMAFVPQVLFRAKKFAYIDKPLYYYYINPESYLMNSERNSILNLDLLKAQKILEESELRNEKDVLETICLKKVVFSLVWKMVEYDSSETDVKQIVADINQKYPQMLNNQALDKSPFYKRQFARFILNGKFMQASFVVSCFCCARKMYTFIRRRN